MIVINLRDPMTTTWNEVEIPIDGQLEKHHRNICVLVD